MNRLSSLDETDRRYLLAPTDDSLDSGGQRSRPQHAIEVISSEHRIS